jgi:hypothetical protein
MAGLFGHGMNEIRIFKGMIQVVTMREIPFLNFFRREVFSGLETKLM